MNIRLDRYVLVLWLLVGGVGMCLSAEPSTQGSLKRSEVKRLLKSAQTPDEFNQLATYFDQRSKKFTQKVQEDDRELDQLRRATFRAKNYPIQVDRARNSDRYDRSEAKKCADEAAAYRLRAKSATRHSPDFGKQNE